MILNLMETVFDYYPGLTVDPQYGRIIFTTVEPFWFTLV